MEAGTGTNRCMVAELGFFFQYYSKPLGGKKGQMVKLITNGQRFNTCSQRTQRSQRINGRSSGSFQLADNLEMLTGQGG